MTIKKTVLLDSETIEIYESYGLLTSGSKNLSAAIRTAARTVICVKNGTIDD